ncbi:MAG: 16S rRNA (cytosine(967)-C(5))-methyltransferase RsmB, partial [Betaproteobacteria bacterium]|nr:16S rRNA (cytosine(967)-C(5))-methyltransferase RsmB [Betaproteobacteria bacterium]
MIEVQIASAEVVGIVLSGKNLDRTLKDVLSKHKKLASNERSAVQAIAFDTLRNYGLLHAQLDTLLSATLSDAPVRHLLLIVLGQLQFSRASAHAIVNHAVSACEQMGYPRAKPLVNAVLRNYLRTPEKFQRERFRQEVALYDFPTWWIERLKKEQPTRWQDILTAARQHPPMCLRVNMRRAQVADYLIRLAEKGISAKPVSDHAIYLEKPMPVNDIPGFREGLVSVQDPGAQLSATLLGVENGMRVLDACAAPGGKSGHLLEIANIHLTALDNDAHRLKRVDENLRRLGFSATVKVADAARTADWWDGTSFDRILLDVPCSGSGVTRRHPDIKWIRRETDLASFARQQMHLLASLWKCLATGGRLLYVTCSVFDSENAAVINRFLGAYPTARQIP